MSFSYAKANCHATLLGVWGGGGGALFEDQQNNSNKLDKLRISTAGRRQSSWQCINITKRLNQGLDRGSSDGGQSYS